MIKIIIRDDDLNFFTKVEDIETVYNDIKGFPVSFAVIPTVVDVSTLGSCPETKGNLTPRWLGDNLEIVFWLKEKTHNGNADVLLHGITHEYRFNSGNKMAEMQWRNEANLVQEIMEQKTRIEELIDYKISVFVAPSNKISKYGLKCVSDCGLHYSGVVPLNFEREVTFVNIGSYIKRLTTRMLFHLPYPGVLRYSDHLELNAATPREYDEMVRIFHYCDKRNLPLAINVHYWHIRDNKAFYKTFFDFIHFAIDKGAQPSRMSDVIKEYNQ